MAAAPLVVVQNRTSSMPTTPVAVPTTPLVTRPVPSTGEVLPVIGLGTWQTFDVGADRDPQRTVLTEFLRAGGRVIDSSPMYGRAEEVVGDLLAERGPPPSPPPFLATKVWTRGKARGEEEMARSAKRLRTARLDLLQVHNLLDWRVHLDTLRAWKHEGRVRTIGVTHYQLGAFDELEQIVSHEKIDFVQLPYSMGVREAEKRLLPAAAHHGVAVLVMRPFEEGALFARVRGKEVPSWITAALGCASWAEVFLKFILGHPAVTCPLPATANPAHLAQNLRAGHGPLPDEPLRRRMIEYVGL
jgi:diketogulonate reductase-like aldo/keto reductase